MSQKCYVSCFFRLEEGPVCAQHRCCLAGRGGVARGCELRRDAVKTQSIKKNAICASDGLGATKWDVSWHLADCWLHPWGINNPMLRPDVSSLQWDDFIPSCSMRLGKSFRLQDDSLHHLAANLFNLHVWLPGWLCWLWCCCFPQGNRFHGWTADRLTSWLTYLLFSGGQRPQGTNVCTHTHTH